MDPVRRGPAGSAAEGPTDAAPTGAAADKGDGGMLGIRPVSQAQLKNLERQLAKGQAKLQERKKELAELLVGDKRVKLAAAVERSVDSYYSESRDLNQSTHEQEVTATGIAPPGSKLHKLREEEARLRRDLKERRRELAAVSAELKSKTDERDRVCTLLRQRELLQHVGRQDIRGVRSPR